MSALRVDKLIYYYHTILIHITSTVTGNCILNFTEQPITYADCNVYEENKIILTCTITSEGVSESVYMLQPNRINIRWYYNNGTAEYELTEGTNETRREGGNGNPIVISSTLTISSTIQRNTASLAEGSYYCQIQAPDQTVASNSSQKFIALGFDQSLQLGVSCSYTDFTARESTCAVYSVFAIMNPITTGSSENLTTINITNMQEDTTTLFIQSITDQDNGVSEIWIYTLVIILAVFLLIIVILTVFVFQLLHMIPRRS